MLLKSRNPKNHRENSFYISTYEKESPFKIFFGDDSNEFDGMQDPVISFRAIEDENFEVVVEEWLGGTSIDETSPEQKLLNEFYNEN